MAKQRPPWFIPRNAASVRYAFFLSHVQRQLVVPNKDYPLHDIAQKLVEFFEQEDLH